MLQNYKWIVLECCFTVHPHCISVYQDVLQQLIAYVCFLSYCSTAPGNQNVPISPVGRGPNMAPLNRGHMSRSTFHGGQVQDRRRTNYNSPGGVPMHSQDTSAMGTTGRFSIFNKLTSKFSRRYATSGVSDCHVVFVVCQLAIFLHGPAAL